MDKNITTYTIGYGNRSIDEFTAVLHHFGITRLIDIRSQPYSRQKPEFTKDDLQKYLAREEIEYIFLGKLLGGRPSDDSCYIDGEIDYGIVMEKPYFRDGIEQLVRMHQAGIRFVLMCGEGKPEDCHRSKLVAKTLEDSGVMVFHIDENGELKSTLEVISRNDNNQMNLFEE